MEIGVRLFGPLRGILHEDSIAITVGARATVQDVLDALVQKNKRLKPLISNLVVAMNNTYVELDTQVQDGDTIALVPPISGGIECLI